MSDQKTLRGPELLCAALNEIIAHPERWKQSVWHCGTTHCVGGTCEVLTGTVSNNTRRNVMGLLGISVADADWLFAAARTLPQLYGFAVLFAAGLDRDGFDRAGFDRAGFDRAGRKLKIIPFDLAAMFGKKTLDAADAAG